MRARESYGVVKQVQVTPTLDTGVYAEGDALHTGAIVLSNAVQGGKSSGFVMGISLVDEGGQAAPLAFHFFDSDPDSSTITANAAFVLAPADSGKYLGSVAMVAGDYEDVGTGVSLGTIRDITLPVTAVKTGSLGGRDIYLVIEAEGTPTYAADDMTLNCFFTQD